MLTTPISRRMRRQKVTGNSRKRYKRQCRRWRNLQTSGRKEYCHSTLSHGIYVSAPASLEKLPCCGGGATPSRPFPACPPALQPPPTTVVCGAVTRRASLQRLAL